jgi:hypothetical protein
VKLRDVPASTGLQWVRLGLQTFWRQPLAMVGLFFLFMLVLAVLSIVPLLGTVLALALLPAATLGLMAATREADSGKFPHPSVLLTALRAGPEQVRAMTVLGGIYAAGFLGAIGLSAVVDGGLFASLYLGGTPLKAEDLQQPAFQQAMWLFMLMYLPLSMLFWHAPALVHWHGVSPLKSLFFSLLACWHNKWALSVFMLAWGGIFVGGGMVMSILGLLLGGEAALGLLVLPLALLMAAMFFTSLYFTFRDSFSTDELA